MKDTITQILCVCMMWSTGCFAQAPSNSTALGSVVPKLLTFSGTAISPGQKPAARITGITFALYKQQQGGAPLWLET